MMMKWGVLAINSDDESKSGRGGREAGGLHFQKLKIDIQEQDE